MQQTTELTARVVDYCPVDHLQDHHNRENEILVGVEAMNEGTIYHHLQIAMEDRDDFAGLRVLQMRNAIMEVLDNFECPLATAEDDSLYWILFELK